MLVDLSDESENLHFCAPCRTLRLRSMKQMNLVENTSSISLQARAIPRKKKRPLVARLFLFLGVATFVAAFNWVYFSWLSPIYGSEGFLSNAPPLSYLILAIVFSLAPSLWMPIVLTRPSQIIYWVLYLTAFIPSMFVPLYTAFQPYYELAKLMTAMLAGLALLRLGYRLPLMRRRPVPSSPVVFWATLGFCSLLLLVWVLYTLREGCSLCHSRMCMRCAGAQLT